MGLLNSALSNLQIQAFGLSMPRLAPAWTPLNVNGIFMIPNTSDLEIQITTGVWAAPISGLCRIVGPGGTLGVTLLKNDGTPEYGPGLLLTVYPQAYVRLAHLYSFCLQGGLNSDKPIRPVPRYFFYPGADANDTEGHIEAFDSLGGRQGTMRVYDNDGLPIDPLAVASAFSVFMTALNVLQNVPLPIPQFNGTALDPGITGLRANAVRVRLHNPNGSPRSNAQLVGLTAVPGYPGNYTLPGGGAITRVAPSANFTQDDANRLVFGPATTGRLTGAFTPPAFAAPPGLTLPPGVTLNLDHDYFSVRVVDFNRYLLGTPNPNDPATGKEERPIVRINEPLNLLADGNQVLTAANAAINGAQLSLSVAQAIDGNFNVGGPGAAYFPQFPGVPVVPNTPVSVNVRNTLNIAAAYFNDGNANTQNLDILLTITSAGNPADLLPNNAWVRIYPRKFLPDAIEGRGDGAGAIVVNNSITVLLRDPLGLRRPQDYNSNVLIPDSPMLRFDMVVVLPNGQSRMFGNLAAVVTAAPQAPQPAPVLGGNLFDNATWQGISRAAVIGLGVPANQPFPNTIGGFLTDLFGEAQPRDAPRLPTMARRELLVAGIQAQAPNQWNAVISGGRLWPELQSERSRIGAPGSFGGRETQAVGVSTQNGRLAFDIARHAFRRALYVVPRIVELNDPRWDTPPEPAQLAIGAPPNANQGTFAGALLQTLSPYADSPEIQLAFNVNMDFAQAWDDIIDWVINNIVLPMGLPAGVQNAVVNQLQGMKNNPPPPTPPPPPDSAPRRLFGEMQRELNTSIFGRRDTLWALKDAIDTARNFIYIETPGFASVAKDYGQNPVPSYAVDLIAQLRQRLLDAPGLHLILCIPKYADFWTGFEGLASYEIQDRNRVILGIDGDPNHPGFIPSRCVGFHPIGFPGRPSRLESTTVIIDDNWALVGGCTLRRRGLTFDGSSDLVFTDTNLDRGRSPAIAAFRRQIMANRLGTAANANDPTFVRLDNGVEAFYAIRELLVAGGLGRIERLWDGATAGVPDVPALTIDQSNPEGRDLKFGDLLAVAVASALYNGF